MSKDWVGNYNSIYKTLGASSHTAEERQENDFYATEPRAVELLLELEELRNVLEPACGLGHISEVLEKKNILVTSSDLIDYGYGEVKDFFDYDYWDGDIVTNPPYKYALEFAQHSLDIVEDGRKIIFLLKLQFLEGQKRKIFFETNPPRTVYVSSSRLKCAINGNFKDIKSSAVAYAWFVWEKGYTGKSIIEWFN